MRSCRIGLLLLLTCLSLPVPAVVAQPSAPAVSRPEDNPLIVRVLRDVAGELLADVQVLDDLRQARRANDAFSMDVIVERAMAWHKQVKRGAGPLVDGVMGSELSRRLLLLRLPRQAVLADLMVADDRGLLIGATRIAPDYDLSGQAKFIAPTTSGPGTLHVEDAAYDESVDDYVVMASILLSDPGDGGILGVLCAKFTLTALQRQ